MAPNFAIIVPVFNTEKYVETAINSLLNQTFRNFIVYAIDDCSTDSSAELLDQIAKLDSRVRVFHLSKNVGVCEARNFALSQIEEDGSFTHIMFVDSDDLVEPQLLDKLSKLINKNESAEYFVFGFNFLTLKGEIGTKFPNNLIYLHNQKEIVHQIIFSSFWRGKCYPNWGVWNKVFSVRLLKGFRFRKGMRLGEDVELLCRVLQRINCGYFLGEVLYHYRVRESSATHTCQASYVKDVEALLGLKSFYMYSSPVVQSLINTVIYRNIFSLYLRAVFYGLTEEVDLFRQRYLQYAWILFKNSEMKNYASWLKYGCCVYGPPGVLAILFSAYQKLRILVKGDGFS